MEPPIIDEGHPLAIEMEWSLATVTKDHKSRTETRAKSSGGGSWDMRSSGEREWVLRGKGTVVMVGGSE